MNPMTTPSTLGSPVTAYWKTSSHRNSRDMVIVSRGVVALTKLIKYLLCIARRCPSKSRMYCQTENMG